jgi:adenine-specific DNA-methyltransferase
VGRFSAAALVAPLDLSCEALGARPQAVVGLNAAMPQNYEGRLELTWTNKSLRLLGHENGSYEWVPPADFRVAEVRLLDSAGSVGQVGSERSRAKDNLLIRGDALNALTSLASIPEFARELVGKVKLVYIDPPFNTQQAFEHYDDALEHSVWLTMMRDRLLQISKLLSPEGSVWVHCDDSEQAYLKAMMDEVFGRQNFVATVIWEKRFSRSNDAIFSGSHDYLVVYAKDPARWAQVRNRLARSAKQSKIYKNPDSDPRGDWRLVPLDAPQIRENLQYPITTPSGKVRHPPAGRHWSMTESKWQQIVDAGLAYFGKDGGGVPMIKKFLKDDPGIVPSTWWAHEEVGHSSEAKREIMALFPGIEAFATPKPERLMERIIHIGSHPGEIVLDCFLGSGTTAAAAHKMQRRWVGVEWSAQTLETFAIPRLSRVVNGDDHGGISEAVSWPGGAGFRVLDVAPSMFEASGGIVALAEWATNGRLSEATAAQLGFEHELDAPFAGRRGRTRLAVVDGLVNEAVVKLLVSALPSEEKLVLAATAVDPDAGPALRDARPGSAVRKIPASILRSYRDAPRWRPVVSDEPAAIART